MNHKKNLGSGSLLSSSFIKKEYSKPPNNIITPNAQPIKNFSFSKSDK